LRSEFNFRYEYPAVAEACETSRNTLDLHTCEASSGLRPYMLINDTVQPAPSGFQATRTVRLRDLNGNSEVVEVDTTKSDKVLTIQFQQTPAEKP